MVIGGAFLEVTGEGEEFKLFLVRLPCGMGWLRYYLLAFPCGRKRVGVFGVFEFCLVLSVFV